MNPYSLPAQTKRFHKLGQLLILANNQLLPEHDSSLPILPSNQHFPPHPESPSPQEKFLLHHTPAPLPPHPASGIPERNASLQDPPCLSATNILTQPQNVSGYVWNRLGGAVHPPPPPGLVQETAAEVRRAESADPAPGDHFYSDTSPFSYMQLLRP